MPFAFHYAARSDVGMVRSNNEDSGYAGPHLLAMADGMGGHAGGDVASSTVVAALVDLDGESLSGRDASQALLDRIREANREIGTAVDDDPRLDGMGTTLIAMLRTGDRIALAHIGDSRAFLLRDGEVTQVTKDHSFVQNLVDEGASPPTRRRPTRSARSSRGCSPAATRTSPTSSCARAAPATATSSPPTASPTTWPARPSTTSCARPATPGECAERLVGLALRAGAPDNVTVIVGDLVDIAKVDAPPTQPQVVGAAAERRRGTRPVPVTPAEKAAALSKAATGADDDADDDGVTLAEEGPRTRRGTVLRVVAALVVAAVVVAGGSYPPTRGRSSSTTSASRTASSRSSAGSTRTSARSRCTPRSTRRPSPSTSCPTPTSRTSRPASRRAAGPTPTRASPSCASRPRRAATPRSQGDECRTVQPGWTPPSPSASPSASPSVRLAVRVSVRFPVGVVERPAVAVSTTSTPTVPPPA